MPTIAPTREKEKVETPNRKKKGIPKREPKTLPVPAKAVEKNTKA